MLETAQNLLGAIPDRMMRIGFSLERKKSDIGYEQTSRELSFYTRHCFRHEKQFFQLPDTPPEFEELEHRDYHGGSETLLKYPSRYQPQNPNIRKRFFAHERNQNGYLFVWRHDENNSRPLVFCVHGFRMGHPKRAKAMFKVRKLFEMGMDVALFIQPHHWKRAENSLVQHFINAEDVPLTIETIGQQIHDLHSCYLGLQQLGYDRIGLIGGSLGGMAVALYATLTTDPEFIFSVVPAIRFDHYLDPKNARFTFKVDLALQQLTQQALDLIDPSFYEPLFDRDKIGLVYHTGDLINDASDTRHWVAKWELKNVTALAGGHWLVFDSKARGRAWYDWLKVHKFY